jgi:hypothetical protein
MKFSKFSRALVKSSVMAMKHGIGDGDDDFCDGDER